MLAKRIRRNVGIALVVAVLGATAAAASPASEGAEASRGGLRSWWNLLWERLPALGDLGSWRGSTAAKAAPVTSEEEAPSGGIETSVGQPVDPLTTSGSEEDGDSDFGLGPDPGG